MINPNDLFDAHRVVRAPNAYRRLRPPSLSGVVIPPVRSPERRATLGRVIQRTIVDRVAAARSRGAGAALVDRARKLARR